MKTKGVSLFLIVLFAWSCGNKFDSKKNLSEQEYNRYLKQLSPYVNKKPDEITYQERFDKRMEPFYQNVVSKTEGSIQYYLKNDTAHFFFYQYKDLSSLFEHYRGFGGYFKTKAEDLIILVNLMYHTPRLTKDEMKARGEALFVEMVAYGNVSKFIGNRKFVHTPNDDFYYNVKENRWDYTENSSWKFLQKEQQRYEGVPATTH